MYKKITSLVLTVAIFGQHLLAAGPTLPNASNFWDETSVTNLSISDTGFQQYTDANGRAVYGLGGSLTLKRRTQAPKQWFHFQPPGIKASCSGVSFQGMFGTIADLDELSQQFEEAGESVAWGILVGIIYSLPGIGEIFQKLDEWAKKIQAMLADSCNAGISIGKAFGDTAVNAAGDSAKSAWDKTMWAGADKDMKDASAVITETLDCGSEMWQNIGTGADCSATKGKIKNTLGGSFLSSPSIITSVLLKNYINHNKEWPTTITNGKSGQIAWSQIDTITAPLAGEIALVAMITASVGDVTVDRTNAAKIISFIDRMDDANVTSENKKLLLDQATEAIKKTREGAQVSEGKIDVAELVGFFINGSTPLTTPIDPPAAPTTTGTTSTTGTPPPLSVPSTQVQITNRILDAISLPMVHFYAQADAGANKANLVALAVGKRYTSNAKSGNDAISTTITDYIKDYPGIKPMALNMKSCYLDNDASSCASARGALIDSDLVRYYAKVYRNTRSIADRNVLGDRYLSFVEHQMAYAIYYKIIEYIGEMTSDFKTHVPVDPSAISGTNISKNLQQIPDNSGNAKVKIVENLKSLKTLYKKALDERFKNDKLSQGEISRSFKAQDRENLKKAFNTNG